MMMARKADVSGGRHTMTAGKRDIDTVEIRLDCLQASLVARTAPARFLLGDELSLLGTVEGGEARSSSCFSSSFKLRLPTGQKLHKTQYSSTHDGQPQPERRQRTGPQGRAHGSSGPPNSRPLGNGELKQRLLDS